MNAETEKAMKTRLEKLEFHQHEQSEEIKVLRAQIVEAWGVIQKLKNG